MTQYPTDLTEKQWQVIKYILDPQARNRKHPLKGWHSLGLIPACADQKLQYGYQD